MVMRGESLGTRLVLHFLQVATALLVYSDLVDTWADSVCIHQYPHSKAAHNFNLQITNPADH